MRKFATIGHSANPVIKRLPIVLKKIDPGLFHLNKATSRPKQVSE